MLNCGQKAPVSPQLKSATLHYQKYVDLTLKGKINAAEVLFNKSMTKLIEQDNMCGLSRLYISKYVLDLPQKNAKALQLSGQYAALDHCSIESNIFNFLAGEPYSIKSLEMPYKAYAQYDVAKNTKPLLNLAEDKSTPHFVKSRVYRFLSKQLMDKNIDLSEKYILEAKKIDSYNGWVFAIQKDLLIYLEICNAQQKECDHINKRLSMLNKLLIKR